MITYEMIESKIDRLVEQGAWVFYDLQAYTIGNIVVDKCSTFVNDVNVGEYMIGERYAKNYKLFEKLEILSFKQDNKSKQTESDIINYLES